MAHTNGHGPAAASQTRFELPALHSRDAELATLGSIMIDPASIWQVAAFLRPADFAGQLTRATYEAMLAMAGNRQAIDLLTLELALRGHDAPPDGWQPWLIGLLNVVPTSMHVESYAREVEQLAVRRRLAAAAERAAKEAYTDGEIEERLSAAELAIFNVRQGRSAAGIKSAHDAALFTVARVEERRAQPGNTTGVPSGFTDLDKRLGGFIAPFPYILAARPGMGKSALVGNIAAHAAKQGKRVLFFAVEMTAEQVITRMIAGETGIGVVNIRDGNLNDAQMSRVKETARRTGDWRLFIDDTPGITPGQIRAKAMRQYAEHGVDLVIVDHLHEMAADTPRNQRHLELADMMRSLKETAKLVQAPMLIVAQLSRAVEGRSDKRPQLADLRESGALEEIAYAALFLYRPSVYDETENPHIAELSIAKNRDGDAGIVTLYWDSKTTKFGNLQRERIDL